jgi:hypothetical protein
VRQRLNDNPLLQAGIIGVLALVVGLMLLMRMGGSSDTATPPAATPAATSGLPATPAPTDPAAAATTDPAAAPAGVIPPATVTPTTAAPPSDFKAGPGLPAPVVDAYDAGKAVALLVVDNRGIDDRDLKKTVEAIGGRSGVALFVTAVGDVSRYSRITQGADLNRTPALIVMRPKPEADGAMPTVVVSYGFRGAASAQQALDNALYKGPADLPYYP